MTSINSSQDTSGIRSLADLKRKDADRTSLGQEDFLELMTTQLQNQDPFKPMENGDFLAQIAQFSTVSGIQDLQASFESLSQSLVSNQALQATGLVGRSVLAPTGIGALEQGGAVKGVVEVPASSNEVILTITDAAGQTIRTLNMGGQATGSAQFQWDGIRDDGEFAAPGSYFFTASANYDGRHAALDTLVSSTVDSVTLGRDGGLLLDLRGVGQLDFTQVRQIL
jgi:flagellar basal-body rod modification protein FlgD